MNRMINIPKQNRSNSNTDRHNIITEKLCSDFSLHMCKVYVSCFNYGNFHYLMFTISGFKEHLVVIQSVFRSGATLFVRIYICSAITKEMGKREPFRLLS